MNNINPSDIKKLRLQTGAGYMACKEALLKSNGDSEKATKLLRQKGVVIAKKKSSRITSEGLVGSYIHTDGKIGVLAEIYCETDFAACTDTFKSFVKDIAMHIAAINPMYLNRDDISANVIEEERNIYRKQLESEDKPNNVIDKIIEGKLNKFYSNTCLLEQKYYKDSNCIVKDILDNCIARIGENITIKRFVRYEIGEE